MTPNIDVGISRRQGSILKGVDLGSWLSAPTRTMLNMESCYTISAGYPNQNSRQPLIAQILSSQLPRQSWDKAGPLEPSPFLMIAFQHDSRFALERLKQL